MPNQTEYLICMDLEYHAKSLTKASVIHGMHGDREKFRSIVQMRAKHIREVLSKLEIYIDESEKEQET